MLTFQKITLDDIGLVRHFLQFQDYRTCDYTIGGIFMWRNFFDSSFAIAENMLFFKVRYLDGRTCFTLPVGPGSVKQAVRMLEEYCRAQALPLVFCTVPAKGLELLREIYGNALCADANRDWFDYLYRSEDLAFFSGKKYHGQRNHVNKFRRLYPGYRFEEIGPATLERALAFSRTYLGNREMKSDTEEHEGCAAIEMFSYLDRFDAVGGFIEVDGNIVALSLGEVVGDTLFVHVEKALREYPGSYQVMVSEFAKHFTSDRIPFINREEDVGEPGLRTSKLSYLPCELLEKHTVTIG